MRADAYPWEGSGWIVTVDGVPVGGTLRKDEALVVAAWLNYGGLVELTQNAVHMGAQQIRGALGKTTHSDWAGELRR